MRLRFAAHRRSLAAGLAGLATLAACGKKSDAGSDRAVDTVTAAEPSAATPVVASVSDANAAAPLTAADVDRWAKGMAAEREAVLAAGRKLKDAKTATDTMNAMGEVLGMSTRDAAAKAAGLSADRWNTISTTLAGAATAYAPLSASMDTTKMSADMIRTFADNAASERARMAQTLPKDVVDALAPRAGELRQQSLELVAQRVKAAGG